jgi:hypothetical protein
VLQVHRPAWSGRLDAHPRHPQATLHSDQRSGVRTTFNSTVRRPHIQAARYRARPRLSLRGSFKAHRAPKSVGLTIPRKCRASPFRATVPDSGWPGTSFCRLHVVLSPSLPSSGVLFEWWTELDATFLKKILKLSDLGPFRASVPARFPLSHHSRPENGGANPIQSHYLLSVFPGPATAFALPVWASRTCAGNIFPRVPPRGRGKSSSRARKTKSFRLFRCLHPNASLLRNVFS